MSDNFTQPERAALLASYNETSLALVAAGSVKGMGDAALATVVKLSTELRGLAEDYRRGVPVVPISRCPFTQDVLRHSFDFFGLDGLWWNYDDPVRPVEDLLATYFALTGSVWLQAEV